MGSGRKAARLKARVRDTESVCGQQSVVIADQELEIRGLRRSLNMAMGRAPEDGAVDLLKVRMWAVRLVVESSQVKPSQTTKSAEALVKYITDGTADAGQVDAVPADDEPGVPMVVDRERGTVQSLREWATGESDAGDAVAAELRGVRERITEAGTTWIHSSHMSKDALRFVAAVIDGEQIPDELARRLQTETPPF